MMPAVARLLSIATLLLAGLTQAADAEIEIPATVPGKQKSKKDAR